MSDTPVAAVVGVGPGLGTAIVRRFAAGYAVAMVARNAEYLEQLGGEVKAASGRALAVEADVADAEQISSAFERIRRELGPVEVMVYNAAMRAGGRLIEVEPRHFEQTWRVSAFGAFLSARAVVPDMLARGRGVILFTGATAGVKPFATSAAFGPAKFALRGLSQVLARDLGPNGIHVAYVNIDGVIDTPAVRGRFAALKEEDMLKPSAIAETYWQLAHQDRSAWTYEADLRPFKEKF